MSDLVPWKDAPPTGIAGVGAALDRSRRALEQDVFTEKYDPHAPFKPLGIVWAGIRVDEFDRMGYDITEDRSLEPGWVRPHPVDPSSFAVWNLEDWRRLCELSRWLHSKRKEITRAQAAMLDAYPSIALIGFIERLQLGTRS